MNKQNKLASLKSMYEENVNYWDRKINAFPSEDNGLVSEDVRTSVEFKECKRSFNIAFKRLQDFNKIYVKNKKGN